MIAVIIDQRFFLLLCAPKPISSRSNGKLYFSIGNTVFITLPVMMTWAAWRHAAPSLSKGAG
jgi:hypothetical protein